MLSPARPHGELRRNPSEPDRDRHAYMPDRGRIAERRAYRLERRARLDVLDHGQERSRPAQAAAAQRRRAGNLLGMVLYDVI